MVKFFSKKKNLTQQTSDVHWGSTSLFVQLKVKFLSRSGLCELKLIPRFWNFLYIILFILYNSLRANITSINQTLYYMKIKFYLQQKHLVGMWTNLMVMFDVQNVSNNLFFLFILCLYIIESRKIVY